MTSPTRPRKRRPGRAAGERVVRVVPGDPFLHPDVAREVAALTRSKVAFELVPGVSPAVAVPGYAGIAVGVPHTVVRSRSHRGDGSRLGWPGRGPGQRWCCCSRCRPISARPRWPCSNTVVGPTPWSPSPSTAPPPGSAPSSARWTRWNVTSPASGRGRSTSAPTLPGGPAPTPVPAVAVIGPAVRTRDKLSWWETRALFGWTVLVPRTREQAGALSAMLSAHGAVPLEVPTIAVEPPRTPAPMDRAITGLVSGRYQWIAFTSTNAVRAVREKLEEYGLDARAFAGVKIATVGDVTAAAVRAWGMEPDLVPSGQQSSEGLLADWPPYDAVLDPIDRVFLPRADIATETLVAGLKERGWEVDDVTAYRTVRASPPPAPDPGGAQGRPRRRGAVHVVLDRPEPGRHRRASRTSRP